jgi:lipid-A-disaccharide synthase
MLKPRASNGRHIFLSCGEASGERYGAALVAALRDQDPSLRFSALGGPALAAAGAEVIQSASDISVMGFAEVLAALPQILAARRRVWHHLAHGQIDLCVPIDFPGFNLKVAARARRLRIPVFYLIPPQLWAWGAWRLRALRRVDCLGTILPFETEYYRQRGLAVEALGHPLMEDYATFPCAQLWQERERRLADPAAPLALGLLPGSRKQEIRHLLPRMKMAALMLQAMLSPRPVLCIVSHGPDLAPDVLQDLVAAGFDIRDHPLPRLLARIDLALVCSGTAALEAALAGVPHVVVYRTSRFSYGVAKRLIKTKRIGLANLILGQDLVPEYIQHEVRPLTLAISLHHWVESPEARQLFYGQCRRLRELCGGPGVWQRAAKAVVALLSRLQEGG